MLDRFMGHILYVAAASLLQAQENGLVGLEGDLASQFRPFLALQVRQDHLAVCRDLDFNRLRVLLHVQDNQERFVLGVTGESEDRVFSARVFDRLVVTVHLQVEQCNSAQATDFGCEVALTRIGLSFLIWISLLQNCRTLFSSLIWSSTLHTSLSGFAFIHGVTVEKPTFSGSDVQGMGVRELSRAFLLRPAMILVMSGFCSPVDFCSFSLCLYPADHMSGDRTGR